MLHPLMMFFPVSVKRRLYWGLIFIMPIGSTSSWAQRTRVEDAFAWYSQSLTIPIGTQWAIHEDGSMRWYGLNRNISFLTLRAGIEYKFNKSWSITAGYTFFDQFKDKSGLYEHRAEHRPWQQLMFRKSWLTLAAIQRFRIEERFFSEPLKEGKRSNYQLYRLRYMASLQISPFKKNGWKSCYFIIQSEVMCHVGETKYVKQTFDQLRVYPHIGYKATAHLDFHAGYMYYYQINPANTQETVGHTLRLAVFYIFNKKQKSEEREEQ